jgi:hypothetical protein
MIEVKQGPYVGDQDKNPVLLVFPQFRSLVIPVNEPLLDSSLRRRNTCWNLILSKKRAGFLPKEPIH